MTEAEYLASTDPAAMLAWATMDQTSTGWRHVSPRKLRLYAVACCRSIWHVLDSSSRKAVEVAEEAAEVEWNGEIACRVRRACEGANDGFGMGCKCLSQEPARAAENAAFYARQVKGQAVAQATLLRQIVGSQFSPLSLPAGEKRKCQTCDGKRGQTNPTGGFREFSGTYPKWESCYACKGLGSLPGSCPWLTDTVERLAKNAYDLRLETECERCQGARRINSDKPFQYTEDCPGCHGFGKLSDGRLDPDRLAILADCLEDAGATDPAFLSPLRGLERRLSFATCGGQGTEDMDPVEEWRPSRVGVYRGMQVLDLLRGVV